FPPSDVLPNELTYSSICLLALILFICLRLIGWSRLGKMLVDCIAITSLVVGPVLITISTRSLFEGHGYENWNAGKLRVAPWLEQTEIVLLPVLIALWRFRGWPIKGAVVLLSFHFFFWGLTYWGQDWWRCLPGLKHLVLPLAASLMWVWSAKLQSSPHFSP